METYFHGNLECSRSIHIGISYLGLFGSVARFGIEMVEDTPIMPTYVEVEFFEKDGREE
jgi:hypothetical protein